MNKEMDIKDMVPVKTSERHVILDALRGFALLGICLANFPEFFALYLSKIENNGGHAYGRNRQGSPLSSIPFCRR